MKVEFSDLMMAMVAGSDALRSVTMGARRVLTGIGRGFVLIDISPVAPSSSLRVAAAAGKAEGNA